MPVILIFLIIGLTLIIGVAMLIIAIQDTRSTLYWIGSVSIILGITFSVWVGVSTDQAIVLDGIYKLETVKTINGSVQIVMDNKNYLHNITNKLGVTFPDGVKVKIEYYEPTTNGIDWLNSRPRYTIIPALQED